MKGKKHKPEQIIKKLREADAMLASGKTIGQVAKTRRSVFLPSSTRCGGQTALATSASKQAALSEVEPRASSKNFARVRCCRFPFPSAMFNNTDRHVLTLQTITMLRMFFQQVRGVEWIKPSDLRQVTDDYFFIKDPEMGTGNSIRIASYAPFAVTVCMNGHNFVAQYLNRRGVGYQMRDNLFVAVDDKRVFRRAIEAFTPRAIERFCHGWIYDLIPLFPQRARRRWQDTIDQTTIARRFVEKLGQPTVRENGQRVPGLNLHNPRLYLVLAAVLQVSHVITGFGNHECLNGTLGCQLSRHVSVSSP